MIMKKHFNVGKRLHEIRLDHGLSQEQLALMADITPSYLGQIERNIKNPTILVIEKLCLSMGVSLADFFSTSPVPYGLDALSLQILTQLENRSNEEKRRMLAIIKDVLAFSDSTNN